MTISKSSSIEEFIRHSDDAETEHVYEPATKKRDRKPVKPQTSQAWRTLEDHLNERRLRHKLKEIYEED